MENFILLLKYYKYSFPFRWVMMLAVNMAGAYTILYDGKSWGVRRTEQQCGTANVVYVMYMIKGLTLYPFYHTQFDLQDQSRVDLAFQLRWREELP